MTWDDIYSRLDEIITEIEEDDLIEEKTNDSSPSVLYAIKDERTGQIIFNARRGPYKDPIKAVDKLNKLKKGHPGRYRIVKYVLSKED